MRIDMAIEYLGLSEINGPLRCDLTVHKTVVDPRKNNVRHSQIPP